MSGKNLRFRAEAREKVLQGATALADAMRVTLGPRSKCVLLGRKWGNPVVCNDGVTIARELELEDPEEDLGVRMLREVATRTGDAVGDGTTTSTLIAHALLREGIRNVVAGASAIDLKRGLERGLGVAVATLRTLSRPVSTPEERLQVATVAAHNDPEIGRLVADALARVGPDGVVTVEEAKGTTTQVEVVEGMRIDHGYLSPYFVTQPDKMECVLEAPLVLLHEKRIASAADLLPLLEHVLRAGRPLLVVAEEVEGEALATLVVNKLRGTLAVVAVKAPGFGDRRKAMLGDLAVLTGAKVVSEELGRRLEQATLDDLGHCERVVATREHTTIVGGGGDHDGLRGRVQEIRQQLDEATSDYDREKLRERLARLAGGVAVVRVGAPSEAELKNLKEAVEDAVSATRAAIAEGIVPGGGLAHLRAAAALEAEEQAVEGDLRTGIRLLRTALETPARQIAANSDIDPGVVVDRMRTAGGNIGLDASNGRYVDLVTAGVVDATKVVRIGLENAVSVAGVLLLTEATMTDVPQKHPESEAPAAAF